METGYNLWRAILEQAVAEHNALPWKDEKPFKDDFEKFINDRIEDLANSASKIDREMERMSMLPSWEPDKEDLSDLNYLNQLMKFCRDILEKDIQISSFIICIVHAFWAEQDPRYHINETKRKYIVEDDWRYQKDFDQLVKKYNEDYKGFKFLKFLKNDSRPSDKPSKTSIDPLIKNMETAIQLLQTRSKAAVIFAKERLQLVKDFRRDYYEN